MVDALWRRMLKVPALAAPQLGSCASSGRAWRLWAARHSQEETDPLVRQPPPRVLEPAASKAADFTAFDHTIQVWTTKRRAFLIGMFSQFLRISTVKG